MPSPISSRMHQRRQKSLRAKLHRQLGLQSLEDRRLLAVVAADGFESADFNGGTEQWAAGNWNAVGDATIRSDTAPASQSEPVNADATDAALSDRSLLEDLSSELATRISFVGCR